MAANRRVSKNIQHIELAEKIRNWANKYDLAADFYVSVVS